MPVTRIGSRAMPGARRPIISNTVVPFTDHAGRPAHSFWRGGEASQPSFSFQVYVTVDLGEGGETLIARFPRELFADDSALWRLDVYEPEEDVWACIEHQVKERQWRGTQHVDSATAGAPGDRKIVDSYTNPKDVGTVAAKCLVIVIDRQDWYWKDNSDDVKQGGPLAVRFDPRPLAERVILPGTLDEGEIIHEQTELQVQRMNTASAPNLELENIWSQSIRATASAQQDEGPSSTTSTEPPPATSPDDILASEQLSTFTTQTGNLGIQTQLPASGEIQDFTLIYTIYPLFTTLTSLSTDDRLATLRSFLAQLALSERTKPTPSTIRLEIAPQFSSHNEILAHYTASLQQQDVGYLSPYSQSPHRRRFPEYLRAATTMHMREGLSVHKRFLVVLDREDWQTRGKDGVSFMWMEPREPDSPYHRRQPEIIVARVAGGIGVVARILGGLL
jgi:hypothetical protein